MRVKRRSLGRGFGLALLTCSWGCFAMFPNQQTQEGNTVLRRGPVSLEVPTHGLLVFESTGTGFMTDPYVFAGSEADEHFISASIESAATGDCVELYRSRLANMAAFSPENVVRGSRGPFDTYEYFLAKSPDPNLPDVRIDQRNIIACKTLGNGTAFIHVSKSHYVDADEKWFAQIFEQTRIELH